MLELGVASATLPGESESGDRYVVEPYRDGVLVGVIDGLGHGTLAAKAAATAAAVLRRHASESVLSLVQRCHEALRETRGVVMSLAAFDSRAGTLTGIGVGNVEGLLMRADPYASPAQETLTLRSGVVGQRLPHLRAEVMPLTKGDTLIFVTDGIHSFFAEGLNPNHGPRQIADHILATQKKGIDDALVLVTRYLGNEE